MWEQRKMSTSLERRSEVEIKFSAVSRATRLGRLIDLDAPGFIIANELKMVNEAITALFQKRNYDPEKDERVKK
jgi:DNA-directed RNA polymerase beta' subunit